MPAFNYRQLIRMVPPRTWKFYFQSRKVDLPEGIEWDTPIDKLGSGLISATENLDAAQGAEIYRELRRVHDLANKRGVDALRNAAKPDASLHEDFPQLSSDAERALWVMANWPDLFEAAEAIYAFNLGAGKRGWKRLKIGSCEHLFHDQNDLSALELALATEFSPKKGTPRACQVTDVLDRHLDGGLQLGILIEDNAQRKLEFGEDNRTHWRDIRPPLEIDIVIYPATGVIELMAPGGAKAHQKLLPHLGKHIFRTSLKPQDVVTPMFYLNRLRDGFELFDDSQVDPAFHRVERIRLSQAKLRANTSPHCDYLIKPTGDKNAPDVLACVKAHHLGNSLLSNGFNILDAVVSLYFLPNENGKAGRVLHIEIKQSGISNLRDMDEADAKLAESLLLAWGVMQPTIPERASESVELAPAEVAH